MCNVLFLLNKRFARKIKIQDEQLRANRYTIQANFS